MYDTGDLDKNAAVVAAIATIANYIYVTSFASGATATRVGADSGRAQTGIAAAILIGILGVPI